MYRAGLEEEGKIRNTYALLTPAIKQSVTPSFYPSLLDQGEDMIIPYLGLVDGEPAVIGSILTHDKEMTGTLSPEDSLLSMMFLDQNMKGARISMKIRVDGKLRPLAYINMQGPSPQNIVVNLFVNLKVIVVEYPHNQLKTEEDFNELNKRLSDHLTKDAEKVLRNVQEARCDLYGVGRQLMAFYPGVWKKLDWEKDFRRITFHPRVEVEIKGTGLIH